VATTNCFVSYDGNGNVSTLANAANGTTLANYEYGPFGEVLRASGPMAKLNPAREGTKFYDDETDMVYYGYRYYNPSTGRWLSRDPIDEIGSALLRGDDASEESGEANCYLFVGNCPISSVDDLGLYVIFWHCPLTFSDKVWIRDSIDKVGERASVVLKQVAANITTISKLKKPYYNDIITGLNEVQKTLQGMVKYVNGNEGLDVYVVTNLSGPNGPAYGQYTSHGWAFKDTLELDTGWFSRPDRDTIMFHEISHGQGTSDTTDDFWNLADKIEDLMTTDKDHWSVFVQAKRADDIKAKKGKK
jgi:RHS repeat-associated protein